MTGAAVYILDYPSCGHAGDHTPRFLRRPGKVAVDLHCRRCAEVCIDDTAEFEEIGEAQAVHLVRCDPEVGP